MAIPSVPSIFWVTLLSVAAILGLATFLGRASADLFPYRMRGLARFYLAPVLGLASLTVVASLLGRILPLGDSVLVPVVVVSLLVWALLRERKARQALRHGLWVSIFGILCGVSVLAPLFVYGAFNAHNDGFTYLAHSNWMQDHAFGTNIAAEQVTPLTTQVFLYQQEGFRMGGSFLLAAIQALLNLKWSYEVYPTLIISSITACCLAIGFPLAQALRQLDRQIRLALLALPAFTLGGLVFGANLGFLPQTLGLALGASLLFAIGPLLRYATRDNSPSRMIFKSSFPSVALFAAAVFTYPELAPFLVIAMVGSGFFIGLRLNTWRKVIQYVILVGIFSLLLLNTELIRAYAALRTQSGAAVGAPVDWTLLGYIAHALGMHGGAWDSFQWTLPKSSGVAFSSPSFFIWGLLLTCLVGIVIINGWRSIARVTTSGLLMPAAVIVAVFFVGIIYFRYFVPSTFPKGTGQSWNQFKLAEWAHPFVMAFVLLAIVHFRKRMEKYFNQVVVVVFLTGFIGATSISVARTNPLIQYYGGTRNLSGFYHDFRQAVLTHCPPAVPIYLALNGQHHKFRQMAIYYLPDREVTSDWMDDVYIFQRLPVERRTQELRAGDCVVEPVDQSGWLSKGASVGSFRIGVFDGKGQIRITSTSGAYGRESDGKNWWHWVERKVIFQLQPMYIPKATAQTKLRFEYATRGQQNLTVLIHTRDGSTRQFQLKSPENQQSIFETNIDLPPSMLLEVSIETDGIASPLGNGDPRATAWLIRNMTIAPL